MTMAPPPDEPFAVRYELTNLDEEVALNASRSVLKTGRRRRDGKPVLVKCHYTYALPQSEVEEVRAGAETLRDLQHPCLVPWIDCIHEDNFTYWVFEAGGGEGLDYYLDKGRQFTEPEVKAVVHRVLQALEHLQRHGLAPGHLEPSRVFFDHMVGCAEDASTARLLVVETPGHAGTGVESPDNSGRSERAVLALGLTAFMALVGDNTSVEGAVSAPVLSQLGRDALDLMIGTDPNLSIPSPTNILQHPWLSDNNKGGGSGGLSSDGEQHTERLAHASQSTRMTAAPSDASGDNNGGGPGGKSSAGVAEGGSGLMGPSGVPFGPPAAPDNFRKAVVAKKIGEEDIPWEGLEDGSRALHGWLTKKASTSNALGYRPWHRRWFLLIRSRGILLYHASEALPRLAQPPPRNAAQPKAIPLDNVKVWVLNHPKVSGTQRQHVLVLQGPSGSTDAMLSFSSRDELRVWEAALRAETKGGHNNNNNNGTTDSKGSTIGGGGGSTNSTPRAGDGDGGGQNASLARVSDGADWFARVSARATWVARNAPKGEAMKGRAAVVAAAAAAAAARDGEAPGEVGKQLERRGGASHRSAAYLPPSLGMPLLPAAACAGTFAKNSALHWEVRAEELAVASSRGKPCNAAVGPGERWYLIDADWMTRWLKFCSSKRPCAPPGPVDNSWMLHPKNRYQPRKGLVMAQGRDLGDYRRVTAEVWDHIMRIYGGGPALFVDGPPVNETRLWKVRYTKSATAAPSHHASTRPAGGGESRFVPNPAVSGSALKVKAQETALTFFEADLSDADDDDDHGDEAEEEEAREVDGTSSEDTSNSGGGGGGGGGARDTPGAGGVPPRGRLASGAGRPKQRGGRGGGPAAIVAATRRVRSQSRNSSGSPGGPAELFPLQTPRMVGPAWGGPGGRAGEDEEEEEEGGGYFWLDHRQPSSVVVGGGGGSGGGGGGSGVRERRQQQRPRMVSSALAPQQPPPPAGVAPGATTAAAAVPPTVGGREQRASLDLSGGSASGRRFTRGSAVAAAAGYPSMRGLLQRRGKSPAPGPGPFA